MTPTTTSSSRIGLSCPPRLPNPQFYTREFWPAPVLGVSHPTKFRIFAQGFQDFTFLEVEVSIEFSIFRDSRMH